MKIAGLFLWLILKGVFGDDMSVVEGDSVTLHTDLTNIQRYERILWTFGTDSTRIVQINNVVNKISLYNDVLNGKFRDRLQLDHQTGSLTITNITSEHSGLYELQIFGGKEVPSKKFSVIVSGEVVDKTDVMKTVSVMVGKSVSLNTGVTEIQSFDVLQWRFGKTGTDQTNPFLVINRANELNSFGCIDHDKRFKDRVQMDQQTGYLTINDVRPTDFGIYKLHISKNGQNMISKTFIVQNSSENRETASEGTKSPLMNGDVSESTC